MVLDMVYWYCSQFCHQMPVRCLTWAGQPLPLCARCTGLYSAIGLVAIWAIFHAVRRERPWTPLSWLAALSLPLLLCLFDGLSGASHLLGYANRIRFLLGFGAGLWLALTGCRLLAHALPAPTAARQVQRRPHGLLIAMLVLAGLSTAKVFALIAGALLALAVLGALIWQAGLVIAGVWAMVFFLRVLLRGKRGFGHWLLFGR